MPDVTPDILQIISSKTRGEQKAIQLSDRLQDLGFQSIDAVELIFDIEEKFNIQIPLNANDSTEMFETVGDIVRTVQDLVAKQA
jgi:acyl carrier protein